MIIKSFNADSATPLISAQVHNLLLIKKGKEWKHTWGVDEGWTMVNVFESWEHDKQQDKKYIQL